MYWEGCGRTIVTSLRSLSHHLTTGTEENHEELRLGCLWVGPPVGRKFIHPGLSTNGEKLSKINKKKIAQLGHSISRYVYNMPPNEPLIIVTDGYILSVTED